MKKLILLASLLLAALATHAQRCVVLDFQIGENVTQEEVESISYEFRSNFNPSCYTVEDFIRVKRVLKELGYNPASMKREQVRKFGRDMVAAVVVYGTLNKYMDEYSLDVLVMDVSAGTTALSQNATFQKSEYRTFPKSVATGIASKLCGSTSVSSGGYGSSTSSKKTVQQGYTDLGLPSGTIWKNFNATGFYTYDEAVSQFGSRLPSKEQWDELKAECQWSWTGSGYKVTGPNGSSITLPAAGYRDCGGSVYGVGSLGNYWSSSSKDSEGAWYLYFGSGGVGVNYGRRCDGLSVRLVQDK